MSSCKKLDLLIYLGLTSLFILGGAFIFISCLTLLLIMSLAFVLISGVTLVLVSGVTFLVIRRLALLVLFAVIGGRILYSLIATLRSVVLGFRLGSTTDGCNTQKEKPEL